jgi:acetylornithine/N-succinyldiaminopimelate aminotransferase
VASRTAEAGFGEVVFFGNSGAEANECAIKLARRHHAAAGRPERQRILAFEGSFHGRTLATLAAAGNPDNLWGFGPEAPGFDHAPYGDLDAAARLAGSRTAAILVEPVQGDGGIRVPDTAFLRGLRELADETGCLLMMDEVQSGMGRTGHLFAHQRVGVVPDVMTLAKGLGGGFPVGACVATRHAAAGMSAGSHASTFGGNPLAMAVASEVLKVMAEPGFLEGVRARGARLASGLDGIVARRPEVFGERRGVGLMQGLRCVADPDLVAGRLREAGLLVAPARDRVLRLLPPLVVDDAGVDEALAILERVATD